MKIRIQTDDSLTEDEIILHCRSENQQIRTLQNSIEDLITKSFSILASQKKKEIYLPVSNILFFETSGSLICAHTRNDMYEVTYKLYELEEFLPGYFMRISKSTIVNIHEILSIHRNLTASSTIKFQDTHKQTYVSRHYFKVLKSRLEEKRNINEKETH